MSFAAALAFTTSACAAGDAIEDTAGDVAEQVETGVAAVPVAATLSCDAERRTLEVAVEAYTLIEGGAPTTEADLVGDYLREESTLFDLDPAGTIVPAPGSTCT